MAVETIIFIILIFLIFTISNFISLIYGVRLGKAMQAEIPPLPVEPVVRAAKKAYSLVKTGKKSYVQKKETKVDDFNIFD